MDVKPRSNKRFVSDVTVSVNIVVSVAKAKLMAVVSISADDPA